MRPERVAVKQVEEVRLDLPDAAETEDETPQRATHHLAEVRRTLPIVRNAARGGPARLLVTIVEKGLVY